MHADKDSRDDEEKLTRRTFLLSLEMDSFLTKSASLNKLHGETEVNVSSLLRKLIATYLNLTHEERMLQHDMSNHNATPLDQEKTSRTFTIKKNTLKKLERIAAINVIEGYGPKTVNSILYNLVYDMYKNEALPPDEKK